MCWLKSSITATEQQRDCTSGKVCEKVAVPTHPPTGAPLEMAWLTHSPSVDESCFMDPENFDCSCHTKILKQCDDDDGFIKKQFESVQECRHFFVCAHKDTCAAYKRLNCKKELTVLKKLNDAGHWVPTC
jgi:hypothetical protein